MKIRIFVLTLIFFSAPFVFAENKVYERAWLGGEFLNARKTWFQPELQNFSKNNLALLPKNFPFSRGVYISRVYESTPIYEAGLRESDVIVRINEKPVETIRQFSKILNVLSPGEEVVLTFYRDEKILDFKVKTGKECFQKIGSFNIFLGFGLELDLFPDPDFSIFSLIRYNRESERMDMNSRNLKYLRNEKILQETEIYGRKGIISPEGWGFWFIPFGIEKRIQILSQEM